MDWRFNWYFVSGGGVFLLFYGSGAVWRGGGMLASGRGV